MLSCAEDSSSSAMVLLLCAVVLNRFFASISEFRDDIAFVCVCECTCVCVCVCVCVCRCLPLWVVSVLCAVGKLKASP